jgi:hypothetical protein
MPFVLVKVKKPSWVFWKRPNCGQQRRCKRRFAQLVVPITAVPHIGPSAIHKRITSTTNHRQLLPLPCYHYSSSQGASQEDVMRAARRISEALVADETTLLYERGAWHTLRMRDVIL